MSTNQTLKNQLSAKKTGEVKDPVDKQVANYLKAYAPTFQQIAPTHFNTERFQRIALSEIRKNPKLLECNIPSLMSAVLQSVKLGLEPGLLGQAYLVPYGKEVQFQIGYKGLIELAQRSGRIAKIQAREVYENDEFEVNFGIEDNIIHKPLLDGDRGKIRLYYAIAWFKDGGAQFEIMNIKQIEEHRDKFSKTKNFGPWKDHFDAMAKKTVLKKLVNQLPMNVEFHEQVQEDNSVRKDITAEAEIIPAEYEIIDAGEVAEGNE